MLYDIYNEDIWRRLCATLGETVPRGGYTLVYNATGFVSLTHPDVFSPINVSAGDIITADNPFVASAADMAADPNAKAKADARLDDFSRKKKSMLDYA